MKGGEGEERDECEEANGIAVPMKREAVKGLEERRNRGESEQTEDEALVTSGEESWFPDETLQLLQHLIGLRQTPDGDGCIEGGLEMEYRYGEVRERTLMVLLVVDQERKEGGEEGNEESSTMCACSPGGRERGVVLPMVFFIVATDCEDDDDGYKPWKVEAFIAGRKLHDILEKGPMSSGCCKTSNSVAMCVYDVESKSLSFLFTSNPIASSLFITSYTRLLVTDA
ncbi:hypothetical protein BDQ12DRAFT_723861 [Crucibulum laeve]|uniref:Uncharacterized protein n=1 Tax=Crucibulum laeve TaxID=68775 RepID=A0A5C3LZE2_9AGAR|nr:hypothetical protein BDQ12DRAFT_723861 [Crucibulum laeve]